MDLVPGFPVVTDVYQMTNTWAIVLSEKYNRRFENDNLVIWRPGMTMWIATWQKDGLTQAEIISGIKERKSKDAYDEREDPPLNGVMRYSYKIKEHDNGRQIKDYVGYYQYAVATDSYVQCAVYCDTMKDIELADALKFIFTMKK